MAQQMVGRQLHVIRNQIDVTQHAYEIQPSEGLQTLSQSLPADAISLITLTIWSLRGARTSLDAIATCFERGLPFTALSLSTLLRTALLGGARVVYILGPPNSDTRKKHAIRALATELGSYRAGIKQLGEVTDLTRLKPPASNSVDLTTQLEALRRLGAKEIRNGDMLDEAASIIGDLTLTQTDEYPKAQTTLADMTKWAWHMLSGVAHANAWPADLPGDFISALSYVVPVVSFAQEYAQTPGQIKL